MNSIERATNKNQLFAVVLLAGLLRILFLDSFPSKLNVDEAAKGYNAFSLIRTGKTFRGLTWPLYFTDYDDEQPSTAIIYNYLVVPSVALFGLTRFAVRLPAAVLGTLTVPILYYLVLALYKDKRIATLSALLLCISPWHIYLSRWGVEPVSYPTFFLLGYLFLQKSLSKNWYVIPGALSLGVCMYTYPSALIIVPLFLAMFFINFRRYWLQNIRYSLLFVLTFLLTTSPLTWLYSAQSSMFGHYNSLSVFSFFEYKKALLVFGLQMLEAFFLLVYLYPVVTLIYFFKEIHATIKKCVSDNNTVFILLLFILSLIPANLTLANDRITVMFIRAVTITGIVEILVARYLVNNNLGVFSINSVKKTVFLLFGANTVFLLWLYTVIYSPTNVYREIGYEKAYKYIKGVEGNYKNVLVDVRENQPFIYLLFYYKYPPELFLSQKATRIKVDKHYTQSLTNFGKYYFCNATDCPSLEGSTLVLTLPGRHLDLKEIYQAAENGEKVLSVREKLD